MLLEGYGVSFTDLVGVKKKKSVFRKEIKIGRVLKIGRGGIIKQFIKWKITFPPQMQRPFSVYPCFNEQLKPTLIFLHFEVRVNYSRSN